jgi:glycosyltransferase involved in cell wall biosynthesis
MVNEVSVLDRPGISVVVPAYRAAATIDGCLDALARQTVPRELYEVIVVHDGTTDEDSTLVRVARHPGVRVYVQEHAGPAAARNLGVEHAVGEIVLFTDADCEPAPNWIEQMVVPLVEAEPPPWAASLAAAGYWDDKVVPECKDRDRRVVGVKGVYRSRQRELVARFVQLEYERKYEWMRQQMAAQGTIDFVDTYSAGYRRDILVENSGFDTSFPVASVEDQELSFRLAKQGYRMVYVPKGVVYHWGHARNVCSYARKKLKIGYWKSALHWRHPEKLWRDSHTPQGLKLQILLVALCTLCLLGAPIWPSLAWGAGILGVGLALTMVPFVVKAWNRDRLVALASPALLLVRALALGAGFAAGLIAGPSLGSQVGA